MKLHTRLYLFFAAMVILPLLVVTIVLSLFLQRSAADAYQTRMQGGLAAASASISRQAQDLSAGLQAGLRGTDMVALGGADPQARSAALTTLVAASGADGALIRDRAGDIVSSAGEVNGPEPPVTAVVDLSGGAGDWQLVLLRRLDQEALAGIFSSLELEWGMRGGGPVSAGTLPVGEAASGQEDGLAASSFMTEVDGRQYMLAVAPIPASISAPGMVLAAGVPAEMVNAASRRAFAVGLTLLMVVTALAGIVGMTLARSITRPLRELTRAAAAGVEGDLGEKVDTGKHDEVGSLASSLGLMQEGLRRHIAELEESRTQLLLALTYAGDILGSTSDRERLMKTTAEAARLATGASGVWVELFEPRQPGERVVSTGVPATFFAGEAARRAGRLAEDTATGKAVTGEVYDFSDAADALAFPLVYNREVLGSLVAIFDRDHPPEESRRKILGSLAVQAASAMENISYGELQRELAITDPMTGLHNFRYLCDSLEKEVAKSSRYDHPLTVAIIDLDDFKAINDTFGHHAGDESLKAVSAVISSRIRSVDIAARYGGEEFAVVLPETAGAPAMKVLESLRAAIAGIRLSGYPDIRVTASIGLASVTGEGDDVTSLLKRADEALYVAKESGKNRCVALP